MRAISTVVDTAVFLLLLGGAVSVLVVGTGPVHAPATGADPADETAEQLLTTTSTIEYRLTPTANRSDDVDYTDVDGDFTRTAHGTTAGLLASAATSAATMDGERLTPASGGFERAVRNETRDRVRRRDTAVAVTATWEPYDGAPIQGQVHVGPDPPANADVRAARVTVDSGFEPAREAALEEARVNGTDGVARVVARSIVAGLFPPETTRVTLRGDEPVDTLTAHRYRRVGRLSNSLVLNLDGASVEALNGELEDALTRELRRDLDTRFASPAAGARTVSTGEVRIVVRTWSP